MRLFSCSGWAALATAAVTGYLASEAVHGIRGRERPEPMIGFFEESEIVDRTVPGRLPTLPAEEIDLTCLQQRPPAEANRQTSEPPLADGPDVLRAIEYRPDLPIVESGLTATESPPPARIPYLTDDTAGPPATLPMPEGDDAADAYPVRRCTETPTGPIWDAVSKFFGGTTRLLPCGHIGSPPTFPGEESGWRPDARTQPKCCDEPDLINPNLGKPPTGVLPHVREVPESTPPPGGSGERQPPTGDG